MSRSKTPLLSFGARGSLASTLTFSRSKRSNIVKRIPSHPDARSLPQLYQRWRFVDAAYYWHSLSSADQAAWHSTARRFNLTGYQYCIAQYLKNPLDQVIWVRFDPQPGPLNKDYSMKGNDPLLFGGTPVPGVIDGALQENGVADYVSFPHNSTLNVLSRFTLTFWLKVITLGVPLPLAAKMIAFGFYIEIDLLTDILWAVIATPDGFVNVWLPPPMLGMVDYHVALQYDEASPPNNIRLLIDGVLVSTATNTGSPDNLADLWLAFAPIHPTMAPVVYDDVRLYSRILSAEQIHNISQNQRFPCV